MHVVYVDNIIVYAATDEIRFGKHVAKHYANVANARIGFVKPSVTSKTPAHYLNQSQE